MSQASRGVRVFVSYSHDTKAHAARVATFAAELEEEGFSVFLDQWQEPPPPAWPVFIERELRRADVVVCVCTPTYRDRVSGDMPPGVGRGATHEGSMLRDELYDLTQDNDRVRLVQLEGMELAVPTVLGGTGTHVFRWPGGRESLVKTLAAPTRRRRVFDACGEAFGDDVDALDAWAKGHVPLGQDVELDFEARARKVVDAVLRLGDARKLKAALEGLAERVGDERRRTIEEVAGALRLGRLSRANVVSKPSPTAAGPVDTPPPRRDHASLDPGAVRRYLEAARSLYGKVQLLGFDASVRVPLRLDDLYVPLTAVIDRRGLGRNVLASEQHADAMLDGLGLGLREEAPVTLANAFPRAAKRRQRGIALLGDPGSGKTTHLKQVLLKVVADGPESIGLPAGTVPVFLPLRELSERGKGLAAIVQQQLQRRSLCADEGFGRALYEHGRLLVLLDGLDEVADAKERAEVARWVEDALGGMPEAWFMVSCRYAGYTRDVALDDWFLELHLRPMDDAQMQAFVERWYASVEAAVYEDPQQARAVADEQAAALVGALSERGVKAVQRVYALTRNPLLLTVICLVHRDRGRLPRARVQLYEEAIGVLLKRHRLRHEPSGELGKTKAHLDREQALTVLQHVAGWMHEEKRERASKAELREPVARALASLRGVTLDAEGFLKEIRDESGLLTGWGVDEYGFMHLGFQEHLAARWIRNEARRQPRIVWELARRFGDSWWQEVILLLVALPNPSMFDELMRAVVRQPGFAAWVGGETMRLCLSEAVEVTAAPFVDLVTLGDGEGRLAERQVAAAELLAREMPRELDGIAEALVRHPTAEVRAWWTARRRHVGRVEVGQPRVRVDERSGVELVWIEGGTFVMGSPEEEAGREVYSNAYLQALKVQLGFSGHPESPQHAVTLAGFWLAKTPVTNAQYRRFLEDPNRRVEVREPENWGDRQYNQDEQPVVGVSWREAEAYCNWAGLVLPTEAQWEHACRAGTTTRYWSGDGEEDLARVGWYRGNSEDRLHAVKEKDANPWGLHDMHGNVWEWCRDALTPYGSSVRVDDGPRKEPVGDVPRVLRGGGWFDDAHLARAACRFGHRPEGRSATLGFRPALRGRVVQQVRWRLRGR